MENININFSQNELFILELALDETTWKLETGSSLYEKFTTLKKKISSARQPVASTPSTDVNDMYIEDLDFTIRTYNGLKRGKINTLSELIKCTDKQLLNLRDIGKRSVAEIDEKLQGLGLTRITKGATS